MKINFQNKQDTKSEKRREEGGGGDVGVKNLNSPKRVKMKMTITSILRHLYAPINFTVKQETATTTTTTDTQLQKMHDQGSTIREKIKQKTAVAADAAVAAADAAAGKIDRLNGGQQQTAVQQRERARGRETNTE